MIIRLICSAVLGCTALSVSGYAQEPARKEAIGPISVLAFDVKSVGMFGYAKNSDDLDTAKSTAIENCISNGGKQCIGALAYQKYGAVAELMIGRERGNALGWASDDTLEGALKEALKRCDSFARNIGITTSYKDEPETLAKVDDARCAIIYFDSSEWDEAVMQVRGQKITGIGDYDRPLASDIK